MDIKLHSLKKLISLVAIMFVLSSCASMQSLSSYARTGDTVMIALGGSEDSNALVDVLKKENILITITDSAGVTYPITLRKLFKLHADYGSDYIHRSNVVNGYWDMFVPALSGQWMGIVDLIDPVSSVPHVLSVGPAKIAVSSPSQLTQKHIYKTFGAYYDYTNGDLASIDIEILPGQGKINTLNHVQEVGFHPMDMLEPSPQIMVSPSAAPSIYLGGGEFTFQYVQANFNSALTAVPAIHDPNIQITSNTKDQGDGTSLLTVTMLNPKGFKVTSSRSMDVGVGNMSPFKSLKFSLSWTKLGTVAVVDDTNWQESIQMLNGHYIDLEGNVLSDITPVMNKVR